MPLPLHKARIGPKRFRLPQAHESEFFNQFAKERGPGLRKTIYRIVGNNANVDEIMQETYLRLWRDPHTFMTANNPAAFAAQTAINLSRNFLQRRIRHRVSRGVNSELRTDIAARTPAPAQEMMRAEQREALQAALLDVPQKSRQIFLEYVERKAAGSKTAHAEIAAHLGISVGQSRWHVHNARTRLAKNAALRKIA